MNIGIIGSGPVGQTLGSKLAALGNDVKIGSRDPQKLSEWQAKVGQKASVGSFAEAAQFGEIIFNCTTGTASLAALRLAGEQNLNGKTLVDVANPLDFSNGMPPTLSVCNTDSLAEQIQRAFPQAHVVKTLNTMNADLMVNPALLPGEHDIFVSGNDAQAKAAVTAILTDMFGWRSVIDLGDIKTARTVEMLLPLWVNLYGKFQTPNFNFKIIQ